MKSLHFATMMMALTMMMFSLLSRGEVDPVIQEENAIAWEPKNGDVTDSETSQDATNIMAFWKRSPDGRILIKRLDAGIPDHKKPFKILCLHGKGGSRKKFEEQTNHLRKRISKIPNVEFEFIFAEAPNLFVEKDPNGRCWWRVPKDSNPTEPRKYSNFGESLIALRKFCLKQQKEHPFDGVMGFSQGGCLANVLIALVAADAQKRADFLAKVEINEKKQDWSWDWLTFRFGIILSGGQTTSIAALPLFKNLCNSEEDIKMDIPVILVAGENDTMIPQSATKALQQYYTKSVMIVHDTKGHVVPMNGLDLWSHKHRNLVTAGVLTLCNILGRRL